MFIPALVFLSLGWVSCRGDLGDLGDPTLVGAWLLMDLDTAMGFGFESRPVLFVWAAAMPDGVGVSEDAFSPV